MAFFIAAIFLAVAIFVPESRLQALTTAIISAAVALFGIPVLVRLFSSFTGDEEILANGVAGSATINSLEPTGWRFNRYYPIVKFNLSVEAGGSAYTADIKQAVEPELLERLSPGSVVAVRVDRENHKKVVIDWSEPIRGSHEATGKEPGEKPSEPTSLLEQPSKRSLWPFLHWGFLLFGLVFLRLSCEEGYYEKGGVRVQGIVLQKTYSPGTRSTGRSHRSSSKHSVSYRFTTKEGRTVEGRYDVLPGTWQSLKEGGPVVIEYLPNSPATNRIPDQRARSGIWRIMALVLLAASALLFIMARRRRLRSSAE
jgi:hypothetical protein